RRQLRIGVHEHVVAHPVVPSVQQRDRAGAGSRPGPPVPQGSAHVSLGKGRGEDTGQASAGAEDIGAWSATAGPAPMLVARSAHAEPEAPRYRVLEEPRAGSPARVDFDQPFQLGMMPVKYRPAAADVRDQEIRLRIRFVGRVELGYGPGL